MNLLKPVIPHLDPARALHRQRPPVVCAWALLMGAVLLLGTGTETVACPACQCGDPTVRLMGREFPRAGLWRLSTSLRSGSTLTGRAGVNEQMETDTRLLLSASAAPSDRLFLSATLPFVRRRIEAINRSRVTAAAPGDLELRARAYLMRREHAAAGLMAGGTLPTAPRQYGHDGAPLDIDVQPGLGAWQGSIGFWGSHHFGDWSLHVSSVGQSAIVGWQDHRPGHAWLNTAALQRRLGPTVAIETSLDLRAAGRDTYGGRPDDTSGGFAAFVSPGLSMTLGSRLVIDAGAQIPVQPPDPPHHRERTLFTLSLTWSR